ncbi:hypothetical protein P7D22_20315 [Lichenihabitans sp. Uapishka_5]|nr:hypothetical protein [Lichenihabitans sp. Uapishka_5]MDX7953513.1 hypothetical protein [Lichenihabitans sp. Uapishka_5]
MSNVKKGQLTPAPVPNVHLRPTYKWLFWKAERLAAKRDAAERMKTVES